MWHDYSVCLDLQAVRFVRFGWEEIFARFGEAAHT